MPKRDSKQIQKELEQGLLWPVYYLYGEERMKARELLKRIKKVVLGEEAPGAFGTETLDGSETTAAAVVDAAMSLTLGGGTRFVIVRDAHLLKDQDDLMALLEHAGKAEPTREPPFVCVFLAKDLDGRKKISKKITELAAAVHCEAVMEQEREAWIGFLAGRRGMKLDPPVLAALRALDPWSLDGVDQELEKMQLLGSADGLGFQDQSLSVDAWIDAFFERKKETHWTEVARFAEHPDEALPRLGLLAWNVRQFLAYQASQGTLKVNPYLATKITRWSKHWTQAQLVELGDRLGQIDFGMKQTQASGLSLWISELEGA